LTTVAKAEDLPWSIQRVEEEEESNDNQHYLGSTDILLVPVQEILEQQGLPEMGDSSEQQHLRLLKVDVGGYELHAFRGLNLERYPFRYILFEFFPQLLKACGSYPIDLLELITRRYDCIQGWSGSTTSFENKKSVYTIRKDLQTWAAKVKRHTNVYCRLIKKQGA
jgi:hypothetical protein